MTLNINKQVSNQICTNVSVLSRSPEAPARDTNSHDNIKNQLGEEDKEKCKEVEGTVTPVENGSAEWQVHYVWKQLADIWILNDQKKII